MSLSRHIDPESVIQSVQEKTNEPSIGGKVYSPYATRYSTQEIPKFTIPGKGEDADNVYQLIHGEMSLDGTPALNLASFVGTFMPPQADKLMMENMAKNLADSDEYPALMALHARCVTMIGNLWHAQPGKAVGSATTGSSEAIHLGGLAMKRRWQEKRRKEGKDATKPNILMGSNAQVALEKFARYFEVEERVIPVCEKSHYRLDPDLIKKNVDENTIGIFVIMGSTYTGHYEPVSEVAKILDGIQNEHGWDVPIHVDGASGAMFAPFCHPSVQWDFRIPRVHSINTSGHKFGLVYAGLGWIIWKSEEYLPKDLVFQLSYLGGSEETYTLNFSRPGAQVVAQYFNFLNLGFDGYKRAHGVSLQNARMLSKALEQTGYYHCVSDIHRKRGVYQFDPKGLVHDSTDAETYNPGLPVVAFRLSDSFQKKFPHVHQAAVSTLLRARGWIIPNYPLPPNEQKTEILRVVVRESLTEDLVSDLLADIIHVTETLKDSDEMDLRAFAGIISHSNRIEKKKGSMGSHHDHKGKKEHEDNPKRVQKGMFARTSC